MNICIPVYDDVDLLDVTGPYEMFTWGGLTVELVAAGPGPIRSRNSFYFFVDKSFSEASPCDVLWVPGGAPDALATQMSDPSRTYLDFLIRQSAQSKWTASVCEGALLLAAAGLLDGYEATTHWAFAACMDRFPKVKLAPSALRHRPRSHYRRRHLVGTGRGAQGDRVAARDAGRARRPAQYPVLSMSAGQQHHTGHASALPRTQRNHSAAHGCGVVYPCI